MERLWPKYARRTDNGKLTRRAGLRMLPPDIVEFPPHMGIAHEYGDLADLVYLIAGEPHTRQAYIPLFHPEDTGISDGGRKVCTLGYHLICRDNRLNIWYPLRSCDLIRHWADDCYLAVRLLLWVLDRCREINPDFWNRVKPGLYSMHATSLHIFATDLESLKR